MLFILNFYITFKLLTVKKDEFSPIENVPISRRLHEGIRSSFLFDEFINPVLKAVQKEQLKRGEIFYFYAHGGYSY